MSEVTSETTALLNRLEDISYPIPEGCKRVPWIERLDYTIDAVIPDSVNINNDIERENIMHDIALQGVRHSLSKLKALNLPYARPTDYFAEMVKSDKQMQQAMHKLEKKH